MAEEKAELKQVIQDTLAARFPGMDVRFESYPGYGKLHGAFIWDGFEGESFIDRQHRVWKALREALTEDQRFSTGFMLMLTPTEFEAMREEAAA